MISAILSTIMIYAASIFALYLGWRLALADDEQKRKNVKGQMVWAVLAIVVVAGILAIWGALSSVLTGDITASEYSGYYQRNPLLVVASWLTGEELPSGQSGPGLLWLFNVLLGVVAALAGFLAIYLGVKLATAESEDKRKNAKAQMIYAILAFILVAALISIFNVVDWGSMLSEQPATSPGNGY